MMKNVGGVQTMRIRPTAAAITEPMDDAHYLPADPANLLHADPQRRTTVRFNSANLTLAGHLYRPPGLPETDRTPGIVMCGPISSVKEQTLPHYAERFSEAGYTVLTFDTRSFGESEGEPRCHYDPYQVIEDYTNAVSYMLTRDDIDANRVAVVGVCMGGSYAVSTGARNKHLRAVVSIAGGYNIGGSYQQSMGIDGLASYLARVNDLVIDQYRTGKVQYIPTVAHSLSDQIPVAAMPIEEAYSYYTRTHNADAPNWENRMTAASLQPFFSYNGIAHAPLVAPTPLMIIHGNKDTALLPEYAQQAYEAAIGPKELIWIDTHNHIELYDQNPYVSEASAWALRWLNRYLKP